MRDRASDLHFSSLRTLIYRIVSKNYIFMTFEKHMCINEIKIFRFKMMETANKIPVQKTGSEFLVSSHFTISHEDRWAPSRDPEAYKSIFKKDYPPLPLTKRERIPSPAPAQIMHKDGRYADHCSLTRSHFVEKPLSQTDYQNSTYGLTKTNFKMDSDKQLKSFQTTHKEYFPVRSLGDAKNSAKTGKKDWMRSHIPQGMMYTSLFLSDVFNFMMGRVWGRGVKRDQELINTQKNPLNPVFPPFS